MQETHTNENKRSAVVRKSPIDSAEYKYYVTDGGIQALTISDPTLDICSCAVSVKVGSFDDPETTPGLAHFLEHMLFMGTEKYPKENEFWEFINQHNGSSNAMTADEATIYYFDISPDAFETAIDMFADFFRSPLFLKDSVEREVSAVNSEFVNGLNSDVWRNYRMTGVFAKEGQPAGKFSTGNDRFLRKEGIWEEVRGFWESKYSSERMCVVIYGNESSSRLREHLKMFEGIPRSRCSDEERMKRSLEDIQIGLEKSGTVFKEEFLNRWITIQPVADKKTLIVSVTVPSEYRLFRNNPYMYVSNAFLSKNERGFIYLMKEEGLAFSSEFEVSSTTDYSVVSITISLSARGAENPRLVLEHLARYLHSMEISESEYRVLRDVSQCLFRYTERLDPSEQTENLAEKMQHYPVENILDAEYLFEEFRRDEIESLVREVSDYTQWLVFFMTKDSKFDQEEDIYGIRYRVGEHIFDTGERMGETSTLGLEEPEEWISVDKIQLLHEENAGCMFRSEELEGGKITHLFNDSYMVPKAHVYFLFRLDDVSDRFVDYVFLIKNAEDMFSKRHDDILYRMQVSIISSVKHYGIEVRFEGFTHGMSLVCRLFFDALFNAADMSRREIIKEEMVDGWITAKTRSPYRLLPDGLKKLRIPGHLSVDEKIGLIQGISTDFRMPRDFFAEVFAVGNIGFDEVAEMFKTVSRKRSRRRGGCRRTEELSGTDVIDIRTLDRRNNACGVYYYLGRHRSHRDTALAHLIAQSCQEMFFDHLRTKEALGYVVNAGIEHLDDALYIQFVVQSERDVSFLETRIRTFVSGLRQYFEDMAEEEFDSFKGSVTSSFQEKHKSLGSYSDALWTRYLSGVVDLAYEDKVVAAVEAVSRVDVLSSRLFDSPCVVKAFAE